MKEKIGNRMFNLGPPCLVVAGAFKGQRGTVLQGGVPGYVNVSMAEGVLNIPDHWIAFLPWSST